MFLRSRIHCHFNRRRGIHCGFRTKTWGWALLLHWMPHQKHGWSDCAQEIQRISNANIEESQSPDLCVLALDAGAGGLARALSVTPTTGEVLVRETGPVLGHTELPIVLGFRGQAVIMPARGRASRCMRALQSMRALTRFPIGASTLSYGQPQVPRLVELPTRCFRI